MKIRIEIPIEKYLKALEGKMLECKYFELVWLERKIQEKYDDFDAFIILHGTNTM